MQKLTYDAPYSNFSTVLFYKMDTYNFLITELKQIPGLANNFDQILAPFKGSFEDDKKRFFGIPSDEQLIFFRTHYCDSYLAITDKGIYTRDLAKLFGITINDWRYYIPFKDITAVKYSESEDGYFFYGNSLPKEFISRSDFFSKGIDSIYRFEFATILTKAAKSALGFEEYIMQGLELMKNDKEQEAICLFDKAIENLSQNEDQALNLGYALLFKARCLMVLEKCQEARDILIIAKDICNKSSDDEKYELLSVLCANLAHLTSNKIDAHKYLCQSYATTPDSDRKKTVITLLNDLHNSDDFIWFFNSNQNLSERKVVMVLSDDSIPLPTTSLICLERKVVKSLELEFPIGHPVDGLLYFAHPTRTKYYIPAMEYEDAVFIEKVNEYCYLLQCLGAKEIKVHKIEGKSYEEMISSNVGGKVGLGHKTMGLNGNLDWSDTSSLKSDHAYKFSRLMTFNPKGNPFVPNDLNWLSIEPRWNRLITNRLNGSLSHYTEEISTSDNRILTEADEIALKAEVKTLVTKFRGQVYIKDHTFSSSKKNTTWRIEVDF